MVKRDVREILENHVGKANAVSSTDIADKLNLKEKNGNPVSRGIIREIVQDGLPVLACSKGYFVAESEKEVREYMDSLDSRIDGIEERKSAVLEAWENK